MVASVGGDGVVCCVGLVVVVVCSRCAVWCSCCWCCCILFVVAGVVYCCVLLQCVGVRVVVRWRWLMCGGVGAVVGVVCCVLVVLN